MTKRFLCAAALLWAASTAANAADLATLQHFLDAYPSAKGQFVQTTTFTDGSKDKTVTQGHFRIQRPGQFEWTSEGEDAHVLMSDGTTLYSYDPGLAQVIVKPLAGSVQGSPAMILFGQKGWENAWTFTPDGPHGLKATPKASESLYQSVFFGFDDKGVLQSMTLIDSLGQKVQYQFKNLQKAHFAPESFVFHAPAGVDVLSDTL